MRRKLLLSLGFLLIGMLVISMVSAQGPHNPPAGHERSADSSGFEGHAGDMDINGTVEVTDAILISLHVAPSAEARERMQDRPGNMPGNQMTPPMQPAEFSNSMTVRIDQLVEFLDNGTDGYTEDDTVVSTYPLNASTLEDPEFVEGDSGVEYTIHATDGTFTIYIYLQEDGGVPHSWKWSVEMTYGFQNSNSQLAITQKVLSNGGQSIAAHHRNELGNTTGMLNQYRDEHQTVPMFFKWDDTAVVDGEDLNVTISRIDDSIAITIPQGEEIFYDPEIGVELDSLESVNNIFEETFGDTVDSFADTVSSPTVIGLLLASGLIATVVIIRRHQ